MLMSLRYLSPHRRGVLRVDKSLILHPVIISVLMHLFFPASLWGMDSCMAVFQLIITWWINMIRAMKLGI